MAINTIGFDDIALFGPETIVNKIRDELLEHEVPELGNSALSTEVELSSDSDN